MNAQKASTTAPAQSNPVAREIEITERTVVEGRKITNFLAPVVCDFKGNMYVRTIADETQLDRTPVLRIKSNGESRLFDASSVGELSKFHLREIAVNDRGELYQLGVESGVMVVAKFSSDGQYSSKVKLDKLIDSYQFAVFPDGQMLIGGFEGGVGGIDLTERRPMTALFDSSGKMLHVLSLEISEGEKENQHAGKLGSYAVLNAQGEIGPDGNFYLLRPYASQPRLYVVSPAGGLVREVALKVPVKNGWPTDLKVGDRRAVVLFSRSPKQGAPDVQKTYAVIDTETGDTLSTFKGDFVAQGFPACYGSDSMFFLTGEKHMMAVAKAKLP
ncbi:MAG: hypothetical protein L0Z53_02320 [Acidobacteriales bacterium]|nr:hypothetical protein [Terriglobales bacterium]